MDIGSIRFNNLTYMFEFCEESGEAVVLSPPGRIGNSNLMVPIFRTEASTFEHAGEIIGMWLASSSS